MRAAGEAFMKAAGEETIRGDVEQGGKIEVI